MVSQERKTMKKYKELTSYDKDDIRELTFKMYSECCDWNLNEKDYKQLIKYLKQLTELING